MAEGAEGQPQPSLVSEIAQQQHKQETSAIDRRQFLQGVVAAGVIDGGLSRDGFGRLASGAEKARGRQDNTGRTETNSAPQENQQAVAERKKQSFSAQFATVERYKVAGGTAEVVDITPEQPKTDVPVFFAPGWGSTTAVYEPALEALSATNRRVITLNHPRFGGSMENLVPAETASQYPTEGLRKALNILGILEQKGIEKTDVIAHSEGAINTVIAATLHPEKFRNIVLFAPAGLIGEDTFTRLLQGFAGQMKRAETLVKGRAHTREEEQRGFIQRPEIPLSETEKQVASTAVTEALKYLAKNPFRGAREGMDIAKTQIHALLRHLHGKNIGIVVMSGVDDPVFPTG